jgi:hypothetical protein
MYRPPQGSHGYKNLPGFTQRISPLPPGVGLRTFLSAAMFDA